MPHTSQQPPPGCLQIMYLYHDVQTSESLVPNCSGSSYIGGRELAQENTTAPTSRPPAWSHLAQTHMNQPVPHTSSPRRGSKRLQDLGLATQRAVPLPKICQAHSIASGQQKPAHGHTRGPSSPPERMEHPCRSSSQARCLGTQQVGIPGRCYH